jgi:hypothetical protein
MLNWYSAPLMVVAPVSDGSGCKRVAAMRRSIALVDISGSYKLRAPAAW